MRIRRRSNNALNSVFWILPSSPAACFNRSRSAAEDAAFGNNAEISEGEDIFQKLGGSSFNVETIQQSSGNNVVVSSCGNFLRRFIAWISKRTI
mmetsp:Transcript_12558/g.24107  ORF Transcript_12558/g.24107 Transcript_12558/m.24107 type:complete len:94 (+) Transcript_12558:1577-1858(+)